MKIYELIKHHFPLQVVEKRKEMDLAEQTRIKLVYMKEFPFVAMRKTPDKLVNFD
jgi:hypothetical protein